MNSNQPSPAFVMATWAVLATGVAGFLVGLWNAQMLLNEKGYYLIALMFGLYAAVSLQKTMRDKQEGLPVNRIYLGITWFACASVIVLLVIGLINANMAFSEKGFYGISFILAMFAAVTAQKNVRDLQAAKQG